MIIYIHGFGGSGKGSKAEVFREYFKSKDEDFIAPSLPYNPKLAIETLKELIQSYKGEVYLIGSSLGGYYASYLSNMPEVNKVVLINPATKPYETLKRALGYAPNFYDDTTFSWEEKHLKILEELKNDALDRSKFMVLLQKGDELLDYKDAQKKYNGSTLIVEDGGNHSFENIDNHFKIIQEFFTTQKELYSTKIYKEALAFALKAHKTQTTPNNLPYSFHIVSVANEIINSLSRHHISYDEANIAITCALLHDVNEDTDTKVSKQTLELENIETITAGVAALTKDDTLPTKQEQMKDSLNRLKKMPACVQMVKLADRITNLDPAPPFWNKKKREAYVDEAKTILTALKDSNPYLAKKLQEKIDNYKIEYGDDFLVFYTKENNYLILDKSHENYLKTFKAINRLNKKIEFFKGFTNVSKKDIQNFRDKISLDAFTSQVESSDERLKKIDIKVIL